MNDNKIRIVAMASRAFHLRTLRSPSLQIFLLRPTHISLHHSHCHCKSLSTPTHRRRLLLLSPTTPLHIRRSRRWDSDGEESYGNDNVSFDTYDESEKSDGSGDQWDEVLEDYIDSIWILKVFGSFGWFVPVILVSMLLANGPKSFLMALAIPMGQSTFTFAIQRFMNRGKIKPKLNKRIERRRSRAYTSTANADWVGVDSKRNKRKEYQSRVSRQGTSSSQNYTSRSSFGGWDELDSAVVTETESKKDVDDPSRAHFGGWDEMVLLVESNVGSSRRGGRKWNRPKGRNEHQADDRIWSASVLPFLMRILICIFPFLSSWIEML